METRLKFAVVGKTSFKESSIEFIVKNNELFAKINIPQNGECDYGLKIVKVVLSPGLPIMDIGKPTLYGFYIQLKYVDKCNSNFFNDILLGYYSKSETLLQEIYNKLKDLTN